MRQPPTSGSPSSHSLFSYSPSYDTEEVPPNHAISETNDGDRNNTLVPIAAIALYNLKRYQRKY